MYWFFPSCVICGSPVGWITNFGAQFQWLYLVHTPEKKFIPSTTMVNWLESSKKRIQNQLIDLPQLVFWQFSSILKFICLCVKFIIFFLVDFFLKLSFIYEIYSIYTWMFRFNCTPFSFHIWQIYFDSFGLGKCGIIKFWLWFVKSEINLPNSIIDWIQIRCK